MAVTFDNATGVTETGATNPVNYSHTVSGTERLLVVITSVNSFPTSPNVTGVTYNGVALTEMTGFGGLYNDAGLDVRLQGWFLIAPDTGANTVAVTWSAGTGDRAMIAASFNGVHQSTPLSNGTNTTGTSTSPSINVSSAANNLVLAGFGVGQPTITEGGGQTNRNEQENINFASALGVSTEPGGASVALEYTFGSGGNGDKWSFGGISINEAAQRFILGTH